MSKIKIVIDTGADMPQELIQKYDFGLLSFLSIFGEETYITGKNITNAEFFEKLTTSGIFPTTSQTPYGDMYDYLLKMCKENESVIYFALSSKASGQHNTAHIVREEILEEYPEADLHIVDTQSFSLYIAQTAIFAAEMVQKGASVEDIIEESKKYIQTWKAFMLVDTLKYLEKGGRLGKTAALVGTLLDIKPILTIEDGLVGSLDKVRGKKKLVDKLIERVEEYPEFDSENPEFLVIHSDEERGQELSQKLTEKYGEGCVKLYSEFGPIIGTHVATGAFAVLCRTKR